MKRIYISKGIDYLEELVEDSRDDKNILKIVLYILLLTTPTFTI